MTMHDLSFRPLVFVLSVIFCCALPSASESAEDQIANDQHLADASVSSASTYLWKPVAIGGGGFITGLDADQTGKTRIVRTDVYGAYLWTPDEYRADGGRWSQLITAASMPKEDLLPRAVSEGVFEAVVAPSDPTRIYIALKGFVYRSDNRGKTFSKLTKPGVFPVKFDPNSAYRFYNRFMAVNPNNPDHVFLGTPEDGLMQSSDAGSSWTRSETVPRARDLMPDRTGIQAPGHLIWFKSDRSKTTREIWVASPGNGIFTSTDGGVTFAPLRANAGERPQTVTQGAFNEDGVFFCVESESRKVWKYDGEWTELAATAGLEKEKLAALAVNPRDQKIYVFTHLGKAFAFDRNGNFLRQLPTRAKVGDGDPPWLKISNRSFAIANVDFDPVTADRIWVAAGTGVYYADIKDGSDGITWISQTRGIEELVTNDIYQAPDRPPLFAAWDFGIHRKENLDVFSESYGPKERVLIAAQQIAGTVSNPDFVVTNASDTLRCCWQDGDAILAGYSTDAGKSWRKFPTLPKPPILDADTGRLGGPWLMSYGMIAVASDDQRNIVWVPSGNKAPYVTRDLGQSWQRIEFPGEILPYTGSHRDYYLGRRVLAADTVEPGTFYLVHSGNPSNPQLEGVWRSTDQGRTWARVYRGEVAPSSGYSAKLRAVPGRAGHLFFTSGLLSPQANRSGLRRSLDGGKTWNTVQGVSDVDDIGFGKALPQEDYPAIYISGRVRGEYGIWRSTDNTGSWHRIATFPIGSLDQVANIAGDPSHFGRVYIGFKGSGWVYGEPTKCVPKSYEPSDFSECFEIR